MKYYMHMIYNRILLSHKYEILSFVATWMGLENIILNKSKIYTTWYHIYVESEKIIQMHL